MGVMELVFGDLNKKEVKKLEKIALQVEAYDEAMQQLTDDELRAQMSEQRRIFRQSSAGGFCGLPGSGLPRTGDETFPRTDYRRYRSSSGQDR